MPHSPPDFRHRCSTAAGNKWTIDPGKFAIRVGGSSENTPLQADVTVN